MSVLMHTGMVVAPHALASEAGAQVLRDGGNAVEAVVAAAATLSVVYPHMCGLGGDAFWTIRLPESGVVKCIEGCGHAAVGIAFSPDSAIPQRGGRCAMTTAGAVDAWHLALDFSRTRGGKLPLTRLFEDAVRYAETGFPVSRSLACAIRSKAEDMRGWAYCADVFMPQGSPPQEGEMLRLPALGSTLRELAARGLRDFYTGGVARKLAEDLAQAGSPIQAGDLVATAAQWREPLRLVLDGVTIFNTPPPTQGISSLMILGICEALEQQNPASLEDGFHGVHSIVEATKQAFALRNVRLADARYMSDQVESWLEPEQLRYYAEKIDARQAAPWPKPGEHGDTVWIGATDASGLCVSCIQSIYHEFGSGVLLPATGVLWHNRALGFSMIPGHPNYPASGKKPFHTLNPPLAVFSDGRVMPYGTMGGEGQPQTQAALFWRYAHLHWHLQDVVSAPRWLLGRAWGAPSDTLKIEVDMPESIIHELQTAGHDVEIVPAWNELMGHAGALVRHASGRVEGAADPRGDGAAIGVCS